MTFLNFARENALTKESFETFLKLLSPLAPVLTQELWDRLGNKGFIATAEFPACDAAKAEEELVVMAVQVNGKVRAKIELAANASNEEILDQAKGAENVKKYLDGKTIKKEIVVPGKIVSIVV